MKIVEWDRKLELGVDSLDREHKMLFSIINKLLTLIEDPNKSERACREGIKYLKNHTIEHYAHEEEYMLSVGYADYEIHKRIHDDFRLKTLPALEEELSEMHYSDSAVRHFLGVVIGWLISHTTTADQAIVGKNVKRWSDVPPEKEMDALEQTIIQTLYDMFLLKSRIISAHYEGDSFGKMICIAFTYQGKERGNWKVIMTFEEKLLLKVVGKLLNTEYKKCDDMVINVTRHITRQFIEKIRDCFPTLDFFNLEDESLMTYEQFLKVYEEEPPSCSMLFDTGIGYLSFGVIGLDPAYDKITSGKKEEDITTDIWRCLNSGHEKKKVMVVDDSNFMRHNIARLLQDEYDVVECVSGMSAITTTVKDRPDLILLDYDMPVCDGRQVLEMLRSEKDTEDISVIFLTGRSDDESIKKVMALKPSGYLLKMMPKEDIKKAIDGFFAQQNGKAKD